MRRRHAFHAGGFRGLTLLEVLIFLAVWALLAVSTMRVLGDSRMLRSNARDRSTMALIAQSEMERLRLLPAEALKEGAETLSRPEWPSGVRADITLTPREDGTWRIDLRLSRESLEGKPTVQLSTIRSGDSRQGERR